MKNRMILLLLFFAAMVIITFACKKDPVLVPPVNYSFEEEFDTVSNSILRGWVIANNTKPIGTASWKQGLFYYENKKGTGDGFGALNVAYSGNDFIMTSSDCGFGTANCSNWLISPAMTVKNGDAISFFTRTYENPAAAADRLQVRLNTVNSASDVGIDSNSIGNFDKVLLDINPLLLLTGTNAYPGVWTKYTITISDIPVAKKTRIGFRYYVPDGGPTGINGLGVGIDKFQFTSN
ncbi:MAG: choice-of-anchor J domain-containing protein [Ferruginibacter sp.]